MTQKNSLCRRALTDAELAGVFELVGRIIANLEALRAAEPEEPARARRAARARA